MHVSKSIRGFPAGTLWPQLPWTDFPSGWHFPPSPCFLVIYATVFLCRWPSQMAFLGGTPNASKPTLFSSDPLLIHREHLPIFDFLWERKNIRCFPDTALCAAPGHLIFLRVGTPVNGDFQLQDSKTGSQCGLEGPLSWGERGSTLVPGLSLYYLTFLLPDQQRQRMIPYFEIYICFTSVCIWYLSSEASNKALILISSYTCFSNRKVVYLCSLSRGLSWGSTDIFEYQCLAKFLKLGPDVQRKWNSFIILLTGLTFPSWILGKGTTT